MTDFWSAPATINWCEDDYAVTGNIAEFWNSLSSLAFCLFGALGLIQTAKHGGEKRFVFQFLGVILIGIGSTAFHATLLLYAQQADETPMVWSILTWTLLLFGDDVSRWSPALGNAFPFVLCLYGAAFSVFHWFVPTTTFFQVHFTFFVALNIVRLTAHYRACHDARARRIVHLYIGSVLVGAAFWMVDFHFCATIRQWVFNPQGHAIWHLILGGSTYFGPLFMLHVRAAELGLDPTVHTWMGIPYLSLRRKRS
eukprot:a4440_101.p1 GENE.a4440_101~~a4440_101.p1  ORF type:complete len:263 (-),score=72.35 a4440_101:346-1107(-)